MNTIVWTGLLAVVGVGSLFYLGAPLIMKGVLWIDPEVPAVDVDRADLPAETAAWFEAAGRDLEAIGFAAVDLFRLNGMFVNVESTFSLFANEAERTLAMAAAIRPVVEGKPQASRLYVEFSTELADGRNLNTNNSADLPAPGEGPEKIVRSFHDVTDPALLWRLHCKSLESEPGGEARRPIPMHMDPVDFFRDEFRRDLEKKIERGTLVREAGGSRLRPTLKGAYLMTWGELPPIKQWRYRAGRRRAHALRAGWGL